MPGTIQNKSGWYEMKKDGQTMALQALVTEDGTWLILDGPMPKQLYHKAKHDIIKEVKDPKTGKVFFINVKTKQTHWGANRAAASASARITASATEISCL